MALQEDTVYGRHICVLLFYFCTAQVQTNIHYVHKVSLLSFHISQNRNGVKYKNSLCINFSGFVWRRGTLGSEIYAGLCIFLITLET